MGRQNSNIEYLLIDSLSTNRAAVSAGLAWLADNGGGCVVTPDKRTMENVLKVETEGQLKTIEAELGRYGITLCWKRRGLPFGSANILALYMDKEIDKVIQHGSVEKILFVPWSEGESTWFKDAYRPVFVEISEEGTLVPAERQPEHQSISDLIPEEQDKILQLLAQMAAGYGNDLQRIERERFKADLKNNHAAWKLVDPSLVQRRCAELGMSAEDADEISGMVKQLHEGHRFRPKPGYEDGWRH